MVTDIPFLPKGLLALIPGAVEALEAHGDARIVVLKKQGELLAHSPEVLATRRDITATVSEKDAVELKHDALARVLDAASNEQQRRWEHYAGIVDEYRRTADFESEVATALPDYDRSAREAWAAFEDAFASRETAYHLLGEPAQKLHFSFRLAHIDAVASEAPYLAKVAELVERFPSMDAIEAALTARQIPAGTR